MFVVFLLPLLLTINDIARTLQWANLPSMLRVCCANVSQPSAPNILPSMMQYLGN